MGGWFGCVAGDVGLLGSAGGVQRRHNRAEAGSAEGGGRAGDCRQRCGGHTEDEVVCHARAWPARTASWSCIPLPPRCARARRRPPSVSDLPPRRGYALWSPERLSVCLLLLRRCLQPLRPVLALTEQSVSRITRQPRWCSSQRAACSRAAWAGEPRARLRAALQRAQAPPRSRPRPTVRDGRDDAGSTAAPDTSPRPARRPASRI